MTGSTTVVLKCILAGQSLRFRNIHGTTEVPPNRRQKGDVSDVNQVITLLIQMTQRAVLLLLPKHPASPEWQKPQRRIAPH